MIKMMKEYFQYRKSRKFVKRKLMEVAAKELPVIEETTKKGNDIINFITRLVNATKNVENEKLIALVLNEVSSLLQTNSNRFIETLTYMANLQPQEIQKILAYSVVHSMPDKDKNEYIKNDIKNA